MTKDNKENNIAQQTPLKKPRKKTINLKNIQTQDKNINKMDTYLLDEETQLQIKYYTKFPQNKVDELIKEVYKDMEYAEKKGLDFFTDEEGSEMLKYVHFMMIKHFTNLGKDIPEDFATKISIMRQIINIGLFRRIFDEVFDVAEVGEVIARFQEIIDMTAKITENYIKELTQLDNRIKNNDVIHPLVNPNKTVDDE